MKLALYQLQCTGDMDTMLEKSIAALREAAKNGADLILFPEIQFTPFFPQYPGRDVRELALTPESDIVRRFCNACREAHIMASPNFYLLENERYYDASLLIGADGNLLGVQKMVHIANTEHFYERDYYSPADDGFHVYDTPLGKIGIVVCYDRHFPESIRTEALMGAELILIPTANTTAEPSEMFAWEIRVQAFQSAVAIAMCNRVGQEDEMDFNGESLVVDANGNIVVQADDRERIVYADIEIGRHKRMRQGSPS